MSDSTITPMNELESASPPPAAGTARRKPSGRSRRKRRSRVYTPEERRQAVEAFYHSKLPQAEFARVWGISNDDPRIP